MIKQIAKTLAKYILVFFALNVVAFTIFTIQDRPVQAPAGPTVNKAGIPRENAKLVEEFQPNEFEKTKEYGILDCTNFEKNAIAGEMFRFINIDREKNNLPLLEWNPKLCQSAKLKTEDMAENQYFEHVSPTYVTPWHWMDVVGYRYMTSGENLALNSFTARKTHEGLMNSPGHRANILNENFTEIGIAYGWGKIDGQDAFFITEHFGTPLAGTKTVEIVCTDIKIAEKKYQGVNQTKKQNRRLSSRSGRYQKRTQSNRRKHQESFRVYR